MKIIITGSIAFDYLMKYPGEFKETLIAESLDHISVSFLVDEMTRHNGGVGPNIAYTLALLGEHPILVGSAGKDFAEYRATLEKVGVDTSGVYIDNELFTASFFVATDATFNQIAMFYTGAMANARKIKIADVVKERPDLVIVSPNDPQAMQNVIRECKEQGINYLYDPSQQVARVEGAQLAEGVEGAHILIVNEYEYDVLRKKTNLNHQDLLKKTENLIVTRGDKGSEIYTSDKTIQVPIVPTTNFKDPTGIGDAFRGGLLKGLAAGYSWEISGRMGALASTYVLEQVGTQNHRYSRREFVERFRENFDDNGILDRMLD